MDSPTRRAWFRPHFQTAVVVAAVCSGVVWLNIGKYRDGTYSQSLHGFSSGWPFVMQSVPGFGLYEKSLPLQPKLLALNALIALCILVAAAIGTEQIVRRQKSSKLPWFRFHLQTAIGMTFVAGGLLWVNLQEYRIIPEWADNEPARVFGWPVTAVTFYSAYAMRTTDDVPEVSYSGLFFDCVCATTLLFVLALIFESLTRRREAREA